MALGTALTTRDRRAMVFGATTVAALVIVGRVLPVWRRWQEKAQTAAEAAAIGLARGRAEIIGHRATHDSLVVRKARLDSLRAAWLAGDTPAAAGAALAGEVSKASEHAGVTIGALDIRVDTTGGSVLLPIRVQATATGDIQGLTAFLEGIESDRVELSIRALSIDAADAASPTTRPEVLRADLTVEGTWHRPSQAIHP